MNRKSAFFLSCGFLIIGSCFGQSLSEQSIRLKLLDSLTGRQIKDGQVMRAGVPIASSDSAGLLTMKRAGVSDTLEVSAPFYRSKKIVLTSQIIRQKNLVLALVPIRIDSATVVAKRKLVFFDNEKIWLDVKSDSSLRGRPLIEAFAKMPFTTVYNQSVKMLDSRATFLMMVDGKRSAVLASSVSAALQSISADSIERIEMLDPAPLRFQQQGFSVVFNIVTKSGLARGYSMQAAADAGTLGTNTSFSGASIGASSDFAARASAANSWLDGSGQQSIVNAMQTLSADYILYNRRLQQSAGAELGYKHKKWGDFYLNASWGGNGSTTARNTATRQVQPFTFDSRDAQRYRQYIGTFATGVGWAKMYGNTDVSASYQLELINDDRKNQLTSFDGNEVFEKASLAQGDGRYQLHQAQLSVALPIGKKHRLEATSQFAARQFKYDGAGELLTGSAQATPSPNPGATYRQRFNQQIITPSVLHTVRLGKYTLATTLGMDFFWQTVRLPAESSNEGFFNWTPSFRITRPVGKRNSLMLSSSRYVRRNSYFRLNPFGQQQTDFLLEEGNTLLPLQVSNNLMLQWRHFGQKGSSFSIQLYHAWTPNAISRTLLSGDTSGVVYSYAAASTRSYIMYVQGSFTPLKRLVLSFNAAVGTVVATLPGGTANQQFFYSFSPNFYYTWPKRNLNVGGMAYLNSPTVNANTIVRGTHLNEVYVNKRFGKSGWMGGLRIVDGFNLNSRQYERSKSPLLLFDYSGRVSTRAVAVTLTYLIQKNGSSAKARRTSTGSGDILR